MNLGQTSTPIDWGKILTGATTLATTYLGYRAATKQPSGAPAPATYVPAPAPSSMSSTTKTLLIGGGILAAGLIIYSLTKKK